jgi:heme/copper-type cytochrome/quinol oxidase subunit 3
MEDKKRNKIYWTVVSVIWIILVIIETLKLVGIV